MPFVVLELIIRPIVNAIRVDPLFRQGVYSTGSVSIAVNLF